MNAPTITQNKRPEEFGEAPFGSGDQPPEGFEPSGGLSFVSESYFELPTASPFNKRTAASSCGSRLAS
ncbi:MAG: hypothetical protein AAB658_14295, partial [Chloroflexota bacterium]